MNKYKKPTTNYTPIPNKFFELELKFSEHKLLLYLLKWCTTKNQFSIAYLAAQCSMSRRAVSTALNYLERLNVISRTSGWTSNSNKKEISAIEVECYRSWLLQPIEAECYGAIEAECIDIKERKENLKENSVQPTSITNNCDKDKSKDHKEEDNNKYLERLNEMILEVEPDLAGYLDELPCGDKIHILKKHTNTSAQPEIRQTPDVEETLAKYGFGK